MRAIRRAAPSLIALLAATACAINPATGKRQLSLLGETQEIEMGRRADEEIVSSLGLYADDDLQDYVEGIGQRMAAGSERPDLPWTFRVVDDPVVNAFALPGGFIYVTRGILAHFQSEAELAAVLGHEIGHVTARHSVNQMSKARLADLGFGLGMVIEPELARYGDLTETGLGLLFLKFGRDDERQADRLGLSYMVQEGYAAAAMQDVFDMLGRVGRTRDDGGSVPGWLSTHPSPENRGALIRAAIAERPLDPDAGTVDRQSYLQRLDGLIFGDDPRQGFFRDGDFFHPDMEFRLRFPPGWETSNQRRMVAALERERNAAVQVTLAEETTSRAAAERFFSASGISRGRSWSDEINGLPAEAAGFTASSDGSTLFGLAAFVAHEGLVFRLLGYSLDESWPVHRKAIEDSVGSFRPLTDPSILSVEPRRVRVVTLPASRTLSEFDDENPSTVPLDTLALINRVAPGDRLPAGQRVKQVIGGPSLRAPRGR